MSNEALFSFTGNAFVFAWLALIVGVLVPKRMRWRSALLFLGGRIIPLALLVVFVCGVFLHREVEPRGDLFTYDGMLLLLSVPERLVNIWVEVLALALFACRWMIDDAERNELTRLPLLICLAIAFISGGLGILCYATVVAFRYLPISSARTAMQYDKVR